MPPGSSPAGPGAAARGSTLGRNSCRGATGARGGSRAAAAREAAARDPDGREAMAAALGGDRASGKVRFPEKGTSP